MNFCNPCNIVKKQTKKNTVYKGTNENKATQWSSCLKFVLLCNSGLIMHGSATFDGLIGLK